MKRLRPCMTWLGASVMTLSLHAGCSDDDGGDDVLGSGSGADTTSTGGMTLTGTTGNTADCRNILADPGFEEGVPNTSWDGQSQIYPTPICNAECSTQAEAMPHGGAWWAWFGGSEVPDVASVSQTVTFGSGVQELSFYLAVFPGNATGDDQLTVRIDEAVVATIQDDAPETSTAYAELTFDVSAFADGQSHVLSFTGELSGVGSPGFFLDDIALYDCSGIADTGTSTGMDTTSTTAEDTTGTSAGSTSGTESTAASEDEGSSDGGTGSETGTPTTSESDSTTTSTTTDAEESSTSTSTTTDAEESSTSGVAEESSSEGDDGGSSSEGGAVESSSGTAG